MLVIGEESGGGVVLDVDGFPAAALPVVQPVVDGDDVFRDVLRDFHELDALDSFLIFHFEGLDSGVTVADRLIKKRGCNLGVSVNARARDGFRKRLVRLNPQANRGSSDAHCLPKLFNRQPQKRQISRQLAELGPVGGRPSTRPFFWGSSDCAGFGRSGGHWYHLPHIGPVSSPCRAYGSNRMLNAWFTAHRHHLFGRHRLGPQCIHYLVTFLLGMRPNPGFGCGQHPKGGKLKLDD